MGNKKNKFVDTAEWMHWKKLCFTYLCRDFYNLLRFGFHKAPRSAQRLYVRPDCIKYYVPGFSRSDSGKVVDGDWDLDLHPLEETPKMLDL